LTRRSIELVAHAADVGRFQINLMVAPSLD
jgi:hypothetical protein